MPKKEMCLNCKFYNAYYIQGRDCFTKQNIGRCKINDEITECHQMCEKWSFKYRPGCWVPKKLLYEAVTNLSIIKKILTEEDEQ